MILLLAAAAQAATPPVPPIPRQRQVIIVRKMGPDGRIIDQQLEGDQAAAQVAEAARNCDPNRTFTSEVDRTVDGKRQVNRIRVCANRTESREQWQRALRDTMARVRTDPNLSPEIRARVVNELVIALDKAGRQ